MTNRVESQIPLERTQRTIDDVKREMEAPFPAEEIKWRVHRKSKKGAAWIVVMPYLDARAIRRRLNEVCGIFDWACSFHRWEGMREVPADETHPARHSMVGGIVCRLGIRIGRGVAPNIATEWIYKEDGSEQSPVEPFKGGLSGALRRAAAAWGIGEYLYESGDFFIGESELRNQRDRRSGHTKSAWIQNQEWFWREPSLPASLLPPAEITPSRPGGASPGANGKPQKSQVPPVRSEHNANPSANGPAGAGGKEPLAREIWKGIAAAVTDGSFTPERWEESIRINQDAGRLDEQQACALYHMIPLAQAQERDVMMERLMRIGEDYAAGKLTQPIRDALIDFADKKGRKLGLMVKQ